MYNRRAMLKASAAISAYMAIPQLTSLGAASAKKNIIQIENEKPGTKDWMLKNPNIILQKDKWIRWKRKGIRSLAIEGYCNKAYVKAGDEISLHVSTSPSADFKVDFYRMGYYQGLGGRHMKTIGPFQGTPQETPTLGEKRSMECNWKAATSIKIPKDWVSGIYVGKLTELKNNSDSYVIFVVYDEREADIAFMASDMSWQSYNRWPESHSLYTDGEKDNHWGYKTRASWDRPYAKYAHLVDQDLSLGSGEFFPWQYPFVYWQEMMGYDVTYISCWNIHYGSPEKMQRTKGLLSVGHDEYWTQPMYDNTKKARDLGLSIGFFGGNSVFGRLNLLPSSDGRTDRMLEREGRFGYENELMGVKSGGGVIGYGHWRCMAPDHWVYEGTNMEFGEEIRGLIGQEYHHDPADIPGLVRIAYGKTDPRDDPYNTPYSFEGRYTASCYEINDGKTFVFCASTFWWTDAMCSPPGHKMSPMGYNERKPDERVQRMTKNILDRMVKG